MRPGNQELAPAELSKLLGGELPSTLPLEGWRTVTLHCQVDAIGPSDRHQDLVKLEVSFPPPTPPCRRCRGRGVIPDFSQWDSYHGEPKPVPCPECTGEVTTCSATMLHAMAGRVSCGQAAGHYDPSVMPVRDQPGGWHQSEPDRDGTRFTWNDMYDAATSHGSDPLEPTVPRPPQRIRITCPTCGPIMPLEKHPRRPETLRCANCKEHLGRGRLEDTTS
ncbi:hypothetical protein ACFWBB_26670 [Streptomyces sp. NPDC060000]|uniref:hypothetical protein n=1 Tax=Streptomyces sp. NPDC060000 TaxID=3347031 RepID=UPI0036CA5F7D